MHTLIKKLLQTNIPGTLMKFIANYIKGRTANITYRNHTSIQRHCKTSVSQGSVLSPTLCNIDTAYLPPLRPLLQVMSSVDYTSQSHLYTKSRVQPRNTYNHTYLTFLPGKT